MRLVLALACALAAFTPAVPAAVGQSEGPALSVTVSGHELTVEVKGQGHVTAGGGSGGGGGGGGGGPPPPLDIELAIDTTGSMGASIDQAQADAKTLVDDVEAKFPGTLFAVVQ